MQRGVRRGAVPEEEILWLRAHLRCESINQLFRDYSAEFGTPYTSIDSFRLLLSKHELYPITNKAGYENVNQMLWLASQGATHWRLNGKKVSLDMVKEPHWLWRWHSYSKRTPTGISFRPYPISLKEIQFGEDMDSRDPD